jgi:hypothetical protein
MVVWIQLSESTRLGLTDGKNMSEKTDKLGRTGKSIGGRPPGSKSARSLRQNKIKQVLDQYIDPLLAKAMKKAEAILDEPLDSKNVTSTTQLSAVKLVVDNAISLRNEVYGREKDQESDPEEDEQSKDVAPVQARFSTKVVSITKSDD